MSKQEKVVELVRASDVSLSISEIAMRLDAEADLAVAEIHATHQAMEEGDMEAAIQSVRRAADLLEKLNDRFVQRLRYSKDPKAKEIGRKLYSLVSSMRASARESFAS